MQKRALVTGGAGFIGSHLCERLLDGGAEVICVDNFFTGDKDNIKHLLDNPYFEVVRHDICFPLYLEVDEIYNLACPASPIHYQHDPVQTTKVNVSGSINMLGLAKRLRCTIFQASTSEVYGDPDCSSPARELLGQRQPHRPARLLRRGQKMRRDPVLRLPAPALARCKGAQDIQHLRAQDAPA